MTSRRGQSGYSLFIKYNFDKMREDLGQDAKPAQIITELAKVWNLLKSAHSKPAGKIDRMFFGQPITDMGGNVTGYFDRWYFDSAWYDRDDQ